MKDTGPKGIPVASLLCYATTLSHALGLSTDPDNPHANLRVSTVKDALKIRAAAMRGVNFAIEAIADAAIASGTGCNCQGAGCQLCAAIATRNSVKKTL